MHDKCAMKVGTDGILLGAWASAISPKTILDIGTGSGVIAIMMAQKFDAVIDAIEIEQDSFLQAEENIRNCKWYNRISIYNTSFQDFFKTSQTKYDLIVCNPPFFTNSLKSKGEGRTIARHNDSLPFRELIEGASKLLSEEGCFCVVLPIEDGANFVSIASTFGLNLVEQVNVKPNYEKPTKRLLLKFQFRNKSLTETTLCIETDQRHHYSDDYKQLTSDFYLYFKF